MKKPFKIAVASGKGGTGKTTLAVNLAVTLAEGGKKVHYQDCDVEEPNGHLFLKPVIESRTPVTVKVPVVSEDICDACRVCASVCEYKAIALIKDTVLIFPELCHSCGACRLFCPRDAIRETPREVGVVERGEGCGVVFTQGLLNIGQVAAPAVIQAVKQSKRGDDDIVIIDCPPGTSCTVIEAVKDADAVILVTEPTPFGLNDLKLAVEMTKALRKPFAVILNRCDIGDDAVQRYCFEADIPIVITIKNDRRIAEAYATGGLVYRLDEELRRMYEAASFFMLRWRRQLDGEGTEQEAKKREAAP